MAAARDYYSGVAIPNLDQIDVDFDFGTHLNSAVVDVNTFLPFFALPRVGECVSFAVDELTTKYNKDITEIFKDEVVYLRVKDIDWYYSKGIPVKCRILLSEYEEK